MKYLRILLFCTVPLSAQAEDLVVQAGEHASFTRLALNFNSVPTWEMGRSNGGYEFRLTSGAHDLDLTNVFERVPRERISGLDFDPETNTLNIASSCDCFANAFEMSGGLIVIDIRDGTPPQTALFEQSLPPLPAPRPARAPMQATLNSILPLFPDDADLIPQYQHIQSELSAEPAELLANSIDLSETRTALLHELSEAAASNLLTPNIDLPELPASQPELLTPTPEIEEVLITEPPVAMAHINFQALNSIEREVLSSMPGVPAEMEGVVSCISDNFLSYETWGDPGALMDNITLARTSLTNEIDETNESSVQNLAKAYLLAGFGAEARAVLDSFENTSWEANLLRTLADIMETGYAEDHSIFEAQHNCPGAVSMWSVLAQPTLDSSQAVDVSALTNTFSGLPLHLRRLLGPPLSLRFIGAGDTDTAYAIQTAVSRADGEHGDLFRLAEAELDLTEDLSDASMVEAEQELSDIASNGSDYAPEALISLMNLKNSQGLAVEEDVLEIAQAFAFELQGDELGHAMNQALVETLTNSLRFEDAFELLSAIEPEISDDTQTALLWAHVFDKLTASAVDIAFLDFVFQRSSDIDNLDLAQETRRAMSSRLVHLGFPQKARDVLKPSSPPTEVELLILARAALSEHNPTQALAEIASLVSAEATVLRAEAYLRLGEFDRASALNQDALPDTVQNHIAWISNDLEQITNVGTPQQIWAATQLSEAPSTPLPVTQSPTEDGLRQAQTLIAGSQEVRSGIQALLQENTID
ncbi:hypothetical protein [Cochlodiniinecator piscidefendens]|uniref:hypothetical protein n=1 Tax=Cochlodiniinecator piscidefendens TaxID=2715756 RepID=UPI00140A745C|nr:hypothetical protein [Cochlodiniinecator piscidefendens]